MLEALKTTLKAIQAMLNKCVKTVNGLMPDADGNVNIDMTVDWKRVTGKPSISAGTGQFSIKEGLSTIASYICSHAEGCETEASGYGSHSEGMNTIAGNGWASHAEGRDTVASGDYSHAEGYGTIALGMCQHVQGSYNIENNGNYVHIVGNSLDENARSNAHTLDWSGNAWFARNVYVGSTSGTNMDNGSKKLATEDYVQELLGVIENGTY